MLLLFVCMGNICRSPAAEGVLLSELEKAGSSLADRVTVDSAGTLDYHIGKLPDHRMRLAAQKRGISLTHRARQVKATDLRDQDLILVMDQDNLSEVRRLDPQGEFTTKIRLFTSFCTTHKVPFVPDPYYGDAKDFNEVLDILQDGCTEIVRQLKAGTL